MKTLGDTLKGVCWNSFWICQSFQKNYVMLLKGAIFFVERRDSKITQLGEKGIWPFHYYFELARNNMIVIWLFLREGTPIDVYEKKIQSLMK